MDVRAVLADVARLGPFFAVGSNPAESVDPTWRPLRELWTDPAPLRDRVAHVGRVLGSDERVAASIAFQGLAARLVSAPFAAVVVHGVLPGLTATTLHWRASASGPWPLWCADPSGAAVDDPVAALAGVLDEQLVPLVAAVRAQVPISARILWGSVASSVASAAAQIATQRPAVATAAFGVAGRLVTSGLLEGSSELRGTGGWSFRRRSCCLYYRVPGGGLCGDCVLQGRAAG